MTNEQARLRLPKGWRLVPEEPTNEMLDAFAGTKFSELSPHKQVHELAAYYLMLTVAPVPWNIAQEAAVQSEPVAHVAIPKSADEAELMLKLGHLWLTQNAPERLAQPPAARQPEAAVQSASPRWQELAIQCLKDALKDVEAIGVELPRHGIDVLGYFINRLNAASQPEPVAGIKPCCQQFATCREMCTTRADYWQGQAEQLHRNAQPPAELKAGWVMVPIEPTRAMLDAAAAEPGVQTVNGILATHYARQRDNVPIWNDGKSPLEQAWRAMLSSAPTGASDV